MGYKGLTGYVQLGQAGMYTDDAPSNVPTANLIKCRNCIIDNGSVLNEPGSVRWNKTQFTAVINGQTVPDGVVGLFDWFPVQDIQYKIIVTRSGRVYRALNEYSAVEVTADDTPDTNGESAPDTLSIVDSVNFVQCGQEAAGLSRKLFIFTGGSQVQVISGTNTTRTNISHPPVDWINGNYPIAGINFLNRVFAWGNRNFPHNVYASSALVETTPEVQFGNEDFVSNPFDINVSNIDPGFSQKVVAAFNYKGRLQVAKYPRGLYYLNLPDQSDPTTWYYSKLSDDIGTTAPNASCNIYDDYWMMNHVSSITSMSAALTLGQLTTADILKQAKVSNFFANIISPLGIGVRQALFNTQTKKAYFLTRKTSFEVAQRASVFEASTPFLNENVNSMMIVFDFSTETQKIMYSDKDQANCMALIKNNIAVDELYLGSEDGYIYKSGQANRSIRYDYPNGQISLAIPSGAGSVPNGTYQYGITNLVGSAESVIGAVSKDLFSNPVPSNASGLFSSGVTIALCVITDHTVKGTIQLSNIPLAPSSNVTGRNIYRSVNGGPFLLLHQLADNTTTSYLDNNATVGTQNPPSVGTDGLSVSYMSEFQTPHMDFTQTDIMTQSIKRADKNFDFLELEYLPTGASNVSVDIYIDGAYSQTQSYYLGKGPQLDVVQLDNFRLQGQSVRSNRLPIGRRGRTISFRVYAQVLERRFNITALRVYFRIQGEADKK